MSRLMISKEKFRALVVAVEGVYATKKGVDDVSICDLIMGYSEMSYRVELYDKDTKSRCFYYQKALLLRDLLGDDMWDDATDEEFCFLLDVFR